MASSAKLQLRMHHRMDARSAAAAAPPLRRPVVAAAPQMRLGVTLDCRAGASGTEPAAHGVFGRQRGGVGASGTAGCAAAAVGALGHTVDCGGGRVAGRSAPRSQRAAVAVAAAAAATGGVSSKAVGVVIVDHGSRRAESNAMLSEFVALYRETTGMSVVEEAHMELAEPTIEQAIGKCAAQGVRRIVIAPYFLSRGRHIQEDIPGLVEEAQAKHPGVECVIADPIGIDPLMVKLINNRVDSATCAAMATAQAQA